VSPAREVSLSDVCHAIAQSPRESCPGPDGLRFEHFKSLLALSKRPETFLNNAGTTALDAFTSFVNVAASGRLPQWYRDPFLAARLFLLQKQVGVLTPRPIAVRGVSARLVAKSLLVDREADIQKALGHQQVGVAVSCGAEGIALAMRQALRMHLHTVAWDAKNAFNSVDRHKVLEQTAALFPDLLEWTAFAYSNETPLFAVSSTAPEGGDPLAHVVTFSSAEGVQQGDPLASLLFCLAVKPALDELTAELQKTSDEERAATPPPPAPSAAMGLCSEPFIVSALMDDVDVAASAAVTLRCIECFAEILKRHCNLDVNWRKSIVHPPLPSHEEGRAAFARACTRGGGTPTEAADGLRCLGAPVSEPSDAAASPGVDADRTFGCPVGGEQYVKRYLDAAGAATNVKIQQITDYVDATKRAAHASAHSHTVHRRRGRGRSRDGHALARRPPQAVADGNLLLLHCILPRLTYLLRVAPPHATEAAANDFDQAILTAFAHINSVDAASFRLPGGRAPTPVESLRVLLFSLPSRHGGFALRSLSKLRSRAYTAGVVDAERVAVSLTAGRAAVSTATLHTIPFAAELGFTAALTNVLSQAAIAGTEATERHGRMPLWKRKGANAEPPDESTIADTITKDCASVLSRKPYWKTDPLKLQHNISLALEDAAFARALDPPVAPGCSRSAAEQSCCNRLAALSMKGVSAWFRTVPTDPALELLDVEVEDSVRYTASLPRVPASLVNNRCLKAASCVVRGRKPNAAPATSATALSACQAPTSSSSQAQLFMPRLDSEGLHSDTCTAGCWSEHHDRIQDLFMEMGNRAGLTVKKAKIVDLDHPDGSAKKADLVFLGFDATDCGFAGFPAFDTTRELVIDHTIPSLLSTAVPDTPLRFLPPHSELRRADSGKVKKHGAAALAKHVTFWPAAASPDYGLGRSSELLYKLIAAAAARLTGEPKWRWHREWRPRFAALRARQRFKGISHVLGMPPLRFPELTPSVAPLALSFSAPSFSPATVAAAAALFNDMDFDFYARPAVVAPSVTSGPSPRSPPLRPLNSVVIAPCDATAPCTARPPATGTVHSPGSVLVDYFHETFVPLPAAGHRAPSAAAPPVASSLLPLTTVPSGMLVVGSGEVVAPVCSTLPQ
jgi:hypothetical protein